MQSVSRNACLPLTTTIKSPNELAVCPCIFMGLCLLTFRRCVSLSIILGAILFLLGPHLWCHSNSCHPHLPWLLSKRALAAMSVPPSVESPNVADARRPVKAGIPFARPDVIHPKLVGAASIVPNNMLRHKWKPVKYGCLTCHCHWPIYATSFKHFYPWFCFLLVGIVTYYCLSPPMLLQLSSQPPVGY